MSGPGWQMDEWADRVASVFDGAAYVNLGVGLPARLPVFLADRVDVLFHCENGIVGTGPAVEGSDIVPEIIDASANPVSLQRGAAVVPFDASFSIIRGGHLDVTVLGAFQVSHHGDLANWSSPGAPVAGVGGAMDLAVGAKTVCVMMHHINRDGSPKIVEELSFPVTARACVDYIVTEYAVINVTDDGLRVCELADGIDEAELEAMTGAHLEFASRTTDRVAGGYRGRTQ